MISSRSTPSYSQADSATRHQISRNDGALRQTTYVYTPSSHRLLYRGSLSVEGSRLLLDGLTFTIPLHDDDSGSNLLDNPLALALESMRGRTLCLSGSAKLSSVHLDRSGGVSLDIHPAAELTKLYLEHQLCSFPIISADNTTEHGIRITLGDPNSQDSSEIMVYGQLPSRPSPSPPTPSTSSLTSSSSLPCLHLRVARIVPAPVPTRVARPDDPSPRFPPPISFGTKRRMDSQNDTLVDLASGKKQKFFVDDVRENGRQKAEERATLNRAREAMTRIPKAPVKGINGVNLDSHEDDVFKVPSLPRSLAWPASEMTGPGKGKAKETDIVKELEKANKSLVKKAAVDCLAAYGIQKTHPEFKELWGFIYRGTEFALRSRMRSCAVDIRVVNRIAKAHAKMYIDGITQPSASQGGADLEIVSNASRNGDRANGEG